MKRYIKLLFFFLILISCKENDVCSNQKKNISLENKKNKLLVEVDTSIDGILVMKKNKTDEDKKLMLKNIAFCMCMSKEQEKIQKITNNQFYLIPDNSAVGYATFSEFDYEFVLRNYKLTKLVDDWSKKVYESKPSEDVNEHTYLIYMKCLDFYNSAVLKKYIDSIKIKHK